MTPDEIRAALEARKAELTTEAERLLAPYRAALGEVERMIAMLATKDKEPS
jgi:DNA-binding transcriptional LysR family regulator